MARQGLSGFYGRPSLAWMACLLWHGLLASAATVTYDFNITWVNTNPDGLADRQTIGINGQWPIPTIRVNVGDTLIVEVLNSLDETTSLHFHGLFMANATHMDGPGAVTQCPIPPGARFTYNITVSVVPTPWAMHAIHADAFRSSNPAPTGTIPTPTASTRTACEAR